MDGLRDLAAARERYGSLESGLGKIDELSTELARVRSENTQLRDDIDELRRDGRRVAELYDLVFEQVRADSRGTRD